MRKLLLLIFFLSAGLLLGAWLFWGSPEPRVNILFISLDTVRADHLSCYGYPKQTSPNLDSLAKAGQLFTRAAAVSSWTLPTHASLFTGLFPATHGAHYAQEGKAALNQAVTQGNQEVWSWFRANGLSDRALTLAEILKEEGYATAGIGAGPWLKPMFGLAQGFTFYDCNVQSVAGRRADEVNRLAMPFLKAHVNEPFFLFLNYFDPHNPYDPPPLARDRFFPPSDLPRVAADPSVAAAYEQACYDGEIWYMDHYIGLVIEELKTLGLYDKTWIIAVSDHGESFGEHGLVYHGYSLYEQEVKTALIVKWPAGWKNLPSPDVRCQQVDILPTILARLGIPAPAPMEGEPLGSVSHPVVCQLYRNTANINMKGPRFDRTLLCVYDEDYKLILSTRKADSDSGLFDLRRDPGEQNDIRRYQPEEVQKINDLLRRWRRLLKPPLDPKRIDSIDSQTDAMLRALGYRD